MRIAVSYNWELRTQTTKYDKKEERNENHSFYFQCDRLRSKPSGGSFTTCRICHYKSRLTVDKIHHKTAKKYKIL
jgi:hypothetical protein